MSWRAQAGSFFIVHVGGHAGTAYSRAAGDVVDLYNSFEAQMRSPDMNELQRPELIHKAKWPLLVVLTDKVLMIRQRLRPRV